MTSKILKEALASCLADSVRSMYQAETLMGFISEQYDADKVKAVKDLLSICRNHLWDVETITKSWLGTDICVPPFRDAVVKVLESYDDWQGIFACNDVVNHAYMDDRIKEVVDDMDLVQSFEFDDRVQAVIDNGEYTTSDNVADQINDAIDELHIVIRR